MKKLSLLLAVFTLITVFNSCKKNELSASNPDPVVPFTPGTTVTTTVAGKVINQQGVGLSGVEITIGSSKILTDAGGSFIIPKATIGDKVGFIKAAKAGFFDGSRTIKPKEKVVNNIIIQMIEKKLSGSFTNASGGTVTVATGGKIEFPAGAVVTKSGAAYTGSVKVSAYYLNPTSKACNREMPGDLRGINTSNNEELLSSFGMMNCELNGSNGEALQIASGKKATITFPVDATLIGNSPATIPLWFFNEAKGMWVQEGTATKSGNNYVGDVNHFTWWNCDWGGGPLEIKATFVDQNKNALDDYHIFFITQGGWGAGGGHGHSASDGTIKGNVPANTKIRMMVSKNFGCGGSTFFWNETTLLDTLIGPFTSSVDIDSVKVTIPNLSASSIRIKGTVNGCNGAAMANGYALIKIGNDVFYDQVTNGVFDKTITYCSTPTTGTATVEFFDLATLNKNLTPISVNVTGAGTYNVGAVSACGIQVAVRYTGTIKDQNGNTPTNYVGVQFTPSLGKDSSFNNIINAIIKANTVITRKIYTYDNCGNYVLVDSTLIGPFAADFNAGVITINIPSANYLTISGTATDCNGANVANGLALIKLDGYNYRTQITNGAYSISITRCSSVAANAEITVIDKSANKQNSTPFSLSVTNQNASAGNIQACGLSSLQNFDYTINGSNYSCTFTNDSLGVDVGSASTFMYGNGSSPSFHYINLNANGTALGTYGSSYAYVSTSTGSYSSDSTNSNMQVIFTEFGLPGQFVAGTFSGNLRQNGTATLKPITGSFRLRRQ